MNQARVLDTEEVATPVHDEDLGGKYVIFFLGAEQYGVPILAVREIIATVPITPIPQSPAHVRGVINLRGKVIPILDLRLKFGMDFIEKDRESCILVVRAQGVEAGVAVDRMSEVKDVPAEEIQPAPRLGEGLDTGFILGIDKSAGKVRLLLDIEKIVSSGELLSLEGLLTEVAPQ
ncbi:MAG: chemotaxis protein CheW [Acidobacteriota bacterium]